MTRFVTIEVLVDKLHSSLKFLSDFIKFSTNSDVQENFALALEAGAFQ